MLALQLLLLLIHPPLPLLVELSFQFLPPHASPQVVLLLVHVALDSLDPFVLLLLVPVLLGRLAIRDGVHPLRHMTEVRLVDTDSALVLLLALPRHLFRLLALDDLHFGALLAWIRSHHPQIRVEILVLVLLVCLS